MNKHMIISSTVILCIFNSLSFCMDLSFPKELLISFGVPNDEARDGFLRTCKFLNQKLSIHGPELINLLNHPLFRTNKKTIQWLAFNAAWNANDNLLKSVMRHMAQPDYVYQYELEYGWNAKFDLESMVKQKMPKSYDTIAQVAKDCGCELDFYRACNQCNDLTMACYNKDDQKVHELLSKNSDAYGSWNHILFIAIDKDSGKCANTLLSHIKKVMKTGPSFANCLRHLVFLKIAMKNGKEKAFEGIVSADIFGCLNYKIYPDDRKGCSALDLITYEIEELKIADGQKYIDIYRKRGGRRFDEFNIWCVLQ